MKKFQIGWVFILAILFASCSGGIVNTYVDNQGKNMPLNDSILALAKAGYVQIDSSGDGNPLVEKVMLVISPGVSAKYQLAKHNGTAWRCYVLLGACIILIILAIWIGNDPGKAKGIPIALAFAAVTAFGFAVASIDWAHVKEQAIPKMTYDSLMKTPDGLKPFWDQHLYQ